MSIVCIIVTYNIDEKIEAVVRSIYKQVERIIIVDNNSDIYTINILKKISQELKNVVLYINEENYGIAKALNIGIEKALADNYDYILTLDHDSIVGHNMISKMIKIVKHVGEFKQIGILSPQVFDINKNDYLTQTNGNEIQEVLEPIQSGMLIKSEVFRKVGYFNEMMKIYYVDTEFCYRAIIEGYKIIQCNNTVIYHEEGKKTKHKILHKNVYYNNYSSIAIYYRARNNIFMLKQYPKIFTSKSRFVIDFFKIIFFDKKPIPKLKVHIKGIIDGLMCK